MNGEGERLKLEAHENLEVYRDVYVRRARRALVRLALQCGTVTADQVRLCVELPVGIDPKLFGVVPGPLARRGIIGRARYVKSARKARHGAPTTLWELKDPAAARQWLVNNPEPMGPVRGENLDLFTETEKPTGATVGEHERN